MHTIGVDKITLFKNHLKQRIISYMFRSSLDHHQGGLCIDLPDDDPMRIETCRR